MLILSRLLRCVFLCHEYELVSKDFVEDVLEVVVEHDVLLFLHLLIEAFHSDFLLDHVCSNFRNQFVFNVLGEKGLCDGFARDRHRQISEAVEFLEAEEVLHHLLCVTRVDRVLFAGCRHLCLVTLDFELNPELGLGVLNFHERHRNLINKHLDNCFLKNVLSNLHRVLVHGEILVCNPRDVILLDDVQQDIARYLLLKHVVYELIYNNFKDVVLSERHCKFRIESVILVALHFEGEAAWNKLINNSIIRTTKLIIN